MQELSTKERLEICKACPIYSKARGICNSALWLNPDTDEVSKVAKAGFIRGCGCAVFYKTQGRSNHCKAGKW